MELRPVDTRKEKKIGRPKKESLGLARRREGKVFQPRFYREDAPLVMEMLSCKTAGELREKFGLLLPDDLPWHSESAKVFSLLESLARRRYPDKFERSLQFEEAH